MKKLIRPLALTTALGVAGVLGTSYLLADPPPPAAGTKPAPAAAPAQPGQPAPPAAADTPMTPIKVTDAKVEMKTAVKPKELGDTVKKGLTYLVKNQQEDGGWNQGGGWRTNDGKGGRVEGGQVQDLAPRFAEGRR